MDDAVGNILTPRRRDCLQTVIDLVNAGVRPSNTNVGIHMDVSHPAVSQHMKALVEMGFLRKTGHASGTRWEVLKVPQGMEMPARPKTDELPCLCCREPFESEGSHNRVCEGCKEQEIWSSAPTPMAVRLGK